MSLNIEIEQKQNSTENINLGCTSEVIKLDEVQQIRNAVQEHLLFIGLDNRNNIRDISLIGIGSENSINVDSKTIIRKALISASNKVILIHNHPSNSLVPSKKDYYITNYTERALRAFKIELLDHIIVTEKDYTSIRKEYKNMRVKNIKILDSIFLMEENEKLKEQVKDLITKLEKN